MNEAEPSFWKSLGPGILFAGAAIGTSHLVQSTRAGAMYGMGLLAIIIFANVIKYPSYRFGPHYAAVTGNSLIEGYRALGRWVVIFIGVIELPVMTIVIAATAITTAAIFLAVFNLPWDPRYTGCVFILLASFMTLTGGYSLLDKLTKFFVLVLTLCTMLATVIALPNVELNFILGSEHYNFKTFAFIIALMGFMPAGLELSIMHSLWTVEKAKSSGQRISVKSATVDLNVGYVLSAILAIFFLIMGSSVMHSNNIEPATSAPAFAEQIINLYTSTLGSWSGEVVGLAAMSVMFTTLLTIIDGMPRLLTKILGSVSSMSTNESSVSNQASSSLIVMTSLLSFFAIIVLIFLMNNFTTFIDFVTITTFLVAPILATLNHLVIFGDTVDVDKRPNRLLYFWSILAISFLVLLSVSYFYFLIIN